MSDDFPEEVLKQIDFTHEVLSVDVEADAHYPDEDEEIPDLGDFDALLAQDEDLNLEEVEQSSPNKKPSQTARFYLFML